MSPVLPDAPPDNWVDRWAPPALRPWLKLGRFDRPTGIWLLMLPGWWGIALASSMAGRLPDVRLLASFALGAVLMRAAGCAFNDIVDRDIDRQVARTAARPVASGEIGVKQAWAFVIACSLISFAILLTLGPAAIALGFASLALVAAYPFMKRITWWPQAWLGMTFNWGVLLGWAAGYPLYAEAAWSGSGLDVHNLHWRTAVWLIAVFLYVAGLLWTLGYDTIYAVQDLEDDALAGVKSSARKLGQRIRLGVGVFYVLCVAFVALVFRLAEYGLLAWLGWAAFAAHLGWQVWRLRPDDPGLCLRLFKSNRDAGLLLFAGLVAGGVWG